MSDGQKIKLKEKVSGSLNKPDVKMEASLIEEESDSFAVVGSWW